VYQNYILQPSADRKRPEVEVTKIIMTQV